MNAIEVLCRLDNEKAEKIYGAILTERNRQEHLAREGRFRFTAANPGLTHAERLPMLTEELGEIAREVQTQPDSGLMPVTHAGNYDARRAGDSRSTPEAAWYAGTPDGLRRELIQLAAIAVAWVEAIDSLAGSTAHAPASTPTLEPPPRAA